MVATDRVVANAKLPGGEALPPHPEAKMEASAIVKSTAIPESDALAISRRMVPAQRLFILGVSALSACVLRRATPDG